MPYRKAPKSSGDAPEFQANPGDHPEPPSRERRYHGIGSAKGFAIGETYEFVRETIEHETAAGTVSVPARTRQQGRCDADDSCDQFHGSLGSI